MNRWCQFGKDVLLAFVLGCLVGLIVIGVIVILWGPLAVSLLMSAFHGAPWLWCVGTGVWGVMATMGLLKADDEWNKLP